MQRHVANSDLTKECDSMKKVKIVSLIALVIAIFFSIDLGINFAYSLVPELNDGIGNRCIINIFGDDGWSHAAYLAAFQKSLWISFAVFVENVVLSIIDNARRK